MGECLDSGPVMPSVVRQEIDCSVLVAAFPHEILVKKDGQMVIDGFVVEIESARELVSIPWTFVKSMENSSAIRSSRAVAEDLLKNCIRCALLSSPLRGRLSSVVRH
jgi:hypothetical protein